MSATVTDLERLTLAEQVARIERSNAETQKFVAEQRKLMAEGEKMAAEQRKLLAEADKMAAEQRKLLAESLNLRFSRFLTPIAAVVGALAAMTAAAPVFVHWLKSVAAEGGGGGG